MNYILLKRKKTEVSLHWRFDLRMISQLALDLVKSNQVRIIALYQTGGSWQLKHLFTFVHDGVCDWFVKFSKKGWIVVN